MTDKPAAPKTDGARSAEEEAPAQSEEDFRLVCRRYSRLRSRRPG